MDDKYFPKKVEQKWQRRWAETRAFEAEVDSEKPKFYALEMLPYPSGNLHMGHVRNYSAGDALAWYKRLKGFNVLHPFGWDSFGQPAEDAAIKRGVNPREWTEDNITAMRGQMERMGFSYDWRRQMFAHRPEYYRWDQWFFLKMYEMGLAYKRMTQVNWCSHDQATLSNEQASGGLCWRCGNPVTKKDLEQWFLKTTAYTEQLLEGLTEIEAGWPASVIKRQRDWMGRSEGAFVDFEVKATDDSLFYCPIVDGLTSSSAVGRGRIRVFTTRIDTIYGANAIVLAAEHPVIQANLDNFPEAVSEKIALIRVENTKPTDHEVEIEKDGIDTGLSAINPFSGEELPIWVGNYVMMEYGTGAVMSVPGHDERDLEFALKFGLSVKSVIEPAEREGGGKPRFQTANSAAFTEYGVLVNSGEWSGMPSIEAKREMAAYAESRRFGLAATTYRLRDWGISRQRFWGAPIPIVYCDACGVVPERPENLPIGLPENIPITGTGESPLANIPEFVQTRCPKCEGPAKRETDTMDTFVDSSWYFFRYTDPANTTLPFDPETAAYWTPVDQYIGGDDHAVMHLIYARFWTKVMRDMGLVSFAEPFRRLLTQGMVVGETFFDDATGKKVYEMPANVTVTRDAKGKITTAVSADGRPLKHAIERMSKSKGNGVDPDEMVDIYGADAARLFTLFAAPIENELVWNEAGIEGAVRFLQRVWRLVLKWESTIGMTPLEAGAPIISGARDLRRKTHQTIKRVQDDFEELQFNTPVAALMELSNAIADLDVDPVMATPDQIVAVREALSALILMLTPYAPHTAEELYSVIEGHEDGIIKSGGMFPEYNEELARAETIEIAVQVNGKLRSRLVAPPESSNAELEKMAFADEKTREYTEGKEVVKVIAVPGRLVNIVVK
ncbi:MAG TPA: leucine--tRNA ligase [Pyrinomonadaceae bacterium]|nr:leucine--tRNA ligase [Pyrinomonadaceae bacterium]